jgi:hypothetical protein
MAEHEREELVNRLANAGWHTGGWTWNPDGTVEVKLRPAPETSGDPVRSIYGTGIDDAIRTELERLAAEGTARES